MPLTSSHFVAVSEGTLVTAAGNDWYKTAQWSGMANGGTTQSVAQVLAVACLAAPSCVGFHLISGGRLGEGALLYDSNSYDSTTWPPETPDAIAAAGGSWAWGESGWSGRGAPAAHGSVAVGKGWDSWEAFRRSPSPSLSLPSPLPPSPSPSHYFLADGGESCSTACAKDSPVARACDLRAITAAAASVATCKIVLSALGMSYTHSSMHFDDDSGCTYHPGQTGWAQVMNSGHDSGATPAPTCDVVNADSSRRRVCACEDLRRVEETAAKKAKDAVEWCAAECRSRGFCCNDPAVGSNQLLSCAQACMVRAGGHGAATCREAVHAPRACTRTVGARAFTLCQACADLGDSCPHGVQSTEAGEVGCALAPLDRSAPASAVSEIVMATEVTLVLKAGGTVEEYEAKAGSVKVRLRQQLQCFSPACVLTVTAEAGSVILTVVATDTAGGASELESAAIALQTKPLDAMSSVLGVTIEEAPAAPSVVDVLVPVTRLPPSPPPQSGADQRSTTDSRRLAAGLAGGAASVMGAFALLFALRRRVCWCLPRPPHIARNHVTVEVRPLPLPPPPKVSLAVEAVALGEDEAPPAYAVS
jgi:hypothetical protein